MTTPPVNQHVYPLDRIEADIRNYVPSSTSSSPWQVWNFTKQVFQYITTGGTWTNSDTIHKKLVAQITILNEEINVNCDASNLKDWEQRLKRIKAIANNLSTRNSNHRNKHAEILKSIGDKLFVVDDICKGDKAKEKIFIDPVEGVADETENKATVTYSAGQNRSAPMGESNKVIAELSDKILKMAAIPSGNSADNTFSALSEKRPSKGGIVGPKTPISGQKSANDSSIVPGEKSPAGIAVKMVTLEKIIEKHKKDNGKDLERSRTEDTGLQSFASREDQVAKTAIYDQEIFKIFPGALPWIKGLDSEITWI